MSPPDTNPAEGFEEALEDLDFERARRIVDRADESLKKDLIHRVRTSRAEATDRAEKLAARIQFLARADHYEGLLGLAEDPATQALLALLSTELRRGATLHLDGAIRRQKRFRAAAERHMKAATEALVLFDTAKAAAELHKVQARWLTEAQRHELSKLRTQTEQAVEERLELENRTAAVLRDHAPDQPPQPAGDSPRAWGSRMRFGGCLGSILAVTTILVAAIFTLITRVDSRDT